MQYTRHNASRWNIDPGKVGVIGFSAGGHLVAYLGTRWSEGDPFAPDPLARYGTRPDWLSWAYGVIHDAELAAVSERTPPAFLAHAVDDRLPVDNSVRFFQALRDKGVPVEMHLYAHGGHGFGLGNRGGAVASWTELYAEWLEGTLPSLGQP